MNNIINIRVILTPSGKLCFRSDTPQPSLSHQLPPEIRIHVEGKDGYVFPAYEPHEFTSEGSKT